MAKIQLNGKKVVIKSNYSLFDLLKKYKLITKKLQLNIMEQSFQKLIIRKKNLKNNDKVEIVHFIGGG